MCSQTENARDVMDDQGKPHVLFQLLQGPVSRTVFQLSQKVITHNIFYSFGASADSIISHMIYILKSTGFVFC